MMKPKTICKIPSRNPYSVNDELKRIMQFQDFLHLYYIHNIKKNIQYNKIS